MPRFIAPLLAGATYARWLHLLIGWVFAGVVLMIYPGTYRKGLAEILMQSVALDAALLALVALVPAMRRAEGVQARLLLVPDREEDIATEPSRTWADRWRTAAWLIGRVALGTVVGFASVAALAAVYALLTGSDSTLGGLRLPHARGQFWGPLAAPMLLLGFGWLVVWIGRLQLAMAVRLLSPSPAERLVEAELRAERLLERNRLARELHDSIGHALTVTVLQAGAAREVGDPAFVANALEVIEETGRRAMDDLERTLVLLREAPERTATENPGVEQLPSLFDTARAAGNPVDALIDVPAGALPGVLSRESYRIVQEGLTNALKYAPGEPVTVRIAVRDGQLELSCANPLRSGTWVRGPAAAGRGGKGLRGIRERAVLLGGQATAGAAGVAGSAGAAGPAGVAGAAGPGKGGDGGDGPGPGEWRLVVRLPLRLGS
ncbi:histidine kinase [Streptomyces sp. SP17BM10]|uniref:sensor histidine kinase n=1 Tax=Streptomyces sp. SP17BM10 TaxID=3002530 RepID=UPI002E7A8D6A|nr:histidine kinase [Streptomyces sp. SP17BM10]MEE1787528.1 histidine kinase [Streptomyces sp. SP17BM10]